MTRRVITAREQVGMLSPWLHAVPFREAFFKEARYPQEWRSEAPYGRLPSGRARNRPPSVRSDPDDRNSEIIDPSEIRYEKESYDNSVSAFHPNGDPLGHYSWESADYNSPAHIGVAQVNPRYQRQGVAGAIIDHIRENYEPDLAHSGFRGVGSLSYQGRAGALRDLGNTEEEHNDYFNTRPYNYGSTSPVSFRYGPPSQEQIKAHAELMQHFEEDMQHPNWTGVTSDNPYDSNMVDEYGDRHEYGYDSSGDYVGLEDGYKNEDGYSEKGYNSEGYNSEGYDRDGYDSNGRDEYGYHRDTGLNRDGETRHGYTPGDGTPPEGTVPMSQMTHHWEQHGLPVPSQEHLDMMEDAADIGFAPTMYAVRHPGEVSPDSGDHHVGNGDTLYSSLERARQVAYHPDDPSQDKNIVSVDHLDPDYLHTDASGKTPEDFHYAPVSGEGDAEDTASTEAFLVHDPQRHQRIQNDLGHGWTQFSNGYSDHSIFDYTHPDSGRTGRMWQNLNGTWGTEHQPEFGPRKSGRYQNHRDAADAIRQGTMPGPTMDQHALEVNNNYAASGGGEVDWEPHPSGKGLMAHTPHGDLHLVQDTRDGRWDWHAGPHGSLPGDEGNMRAPLSYRLNDAAEAGIQAITRNPFHGGLGDELGEGWSRHPTASAAFTKPLPSGNHAFIRKNADGTYHSGIQRDNGRGQPYASPIALRDSDDLAQAKAFIHHRENPVPESALGEGWRGDDMGPRSFPSYVYEGHPSGSAATVAWGGGGPRSRDGDKPGWLPTVHHGGDLHPGPIHKTPQEAAQWASKFMDGLGNGQ